jgi:hypothetical protein
VAVTAVAGRATTGTKVFSDYVRESRMSDSLIDRLVGWVTSEVEDQDYEVAGYVLERRDPDPNPRVTTYDERMSPEEIEGEGGLPSGEYLLQELKDNGMVGETVWHEELTFGE